MLSQCCDTNHQENRRPNFMNQADRESIRQLISQKYCRCIGQHHAQSGPEHDPEDAVETCRQCHQFDDLFAHMLARKLACLLAAPLLKSNSQKIAELEQLYSASLPQARQSDASERRPLPLPDSWLQAR